MPSVEIDFETYKALTMRRANEGVTYGDVIRELLGLAGKAEARPASTGPGVTMKGVHFPEGTVFRTTYKGETHTAEIKNGKWVTSDGEVRTSPSQAAVEITKGGVNGWWFWEGKRPSDAEWIRIGYLREKKAA